MRLVFISLNGARNSHPKRMSKLDLALSVPGQIYKYLNIRPPFCPLYWDFSIYVFFHCKVDFFFSKQSSAWYAVLTETIRNRTSGAARQHSAFTYGSLLWRDLKGIKMYPGHMTLGSYSRSIIMKTHVDTNLAWNRNRVAQVKFVTENVIIW